LSIDQKEMNRRLVRLAESPRLRIWRQDYETLSRPECVFLLVWELEAEVNNGGFQQYFCNTSGRYAPQAAGALRDIGAAKMAAIVDEAVTAVGRDRLARDDAQRRLGINALPAHIKTRLAALDEQFFGYPDNLTALLYAYVSRHQDQIGTLSTS
jgi:hypothetical protein